MRRFTALLLALALSLSLCAPALAESPVAQAMATVAAFVQQTLDDSGLNYIVDEDDPTRFILLYESNDGRMGDVYAYLDAYSSGVLIWASYYEDIPLDRIDESVRFVNMVNAELLGRKYFITPDTGTVVYELHFFMDANNLGAYESEKIVDYLAAIVSDIDYDIDYFAAIMSGETAENAFAMYMADLDK